MNSNWIACGLAPFLFTPLWMQGASSSTSPREGLVRVGTSAQQAQQDERTPFDANLWREKLTQTDLDARQRDFERLVDLARDDDAARKALEDWTKGGSGPELAWTSRLALRELGARRGGLQRLGASPPGLRGRGFDDLRQRFDELQRRFGGLDSMFEDMQREMERMDSGALRPAPAPWWNPSGSSPGSNSQGFSMQVGPDGVKVETTEDVNGKKETKTYEAKSLDELLAAHPELRDRIGPRVQIFGGGKGFDPFGGDNLFGTVRPIPGGLRTDVLGVIIRKPTADEASSAKLEPDVGLEVESVEPGTIAYKIGVQPGDILIEMNGRALKGREDVRDVLAQRRNDEDVQLTLTDSKGKRTTLTWRASGDEKKDEGRKF